MTQTGKLFVVAMIAVGAAVGFVAGRRPGVDPWLDKLEKLQRQLCSCTDRTCVLTAIGRWQRTLFAHAQSHGVPGHVSEDEHRIEMAFSSCQIAMTRRFPTPVDARGFPVDETALFSSISVDPDPGPLALDVTTRGSILVLHFENQSDDTLHVPFRRRDGRPAWDWLTVILARPGGGDFAEQRVISATGSGAVDYVDIDAGATYTAEVDLRPLAPAPPLSGEYDVSVIWDMSNVPGFEGKLMRQAKLSLPMQGQ